MIANIAAMTIGFGLGTACAVIAISVTLSQVLEKIFPSGTATEAKPETTETKPEENERLKKQIENFLNYNGSSKGQIEIGDDE